MGKSYSTGKLIVRYTIQDIVKRKALEYVFKNLTTTSRSIYMENSPQLALAYSGVGNFSSKQGNPEPFGSLFKFSSGDNHSGESPNALGGLLKELETKKSIHGGENHIEVATLYNMIGTVYEEQNKLSKAIAYLSKALEIEKSIKRENNPEIAVSYDRIGVKYVNQDENEKALECFLEALELKKSIFGGENHIEVARSHSYIGGVYH